MCIPVSRHWAQILPTLFPLAFRRLYWQFLTEHVLCLAYLTDFWYPETERKGGWERRGLVRERSDKLFEIQKQTSLSLKSLADTPTCLLMYAEFIRAISLWGASRLWVVAARAASGIFPTVKNEHKQPIQHRKTDRQTDDTSYLSKQEIKRVSQLTLKVSISKVVEVEGEEVATFFRIISELTQWPRAVILTL